MPEIPLSVDKSFCLCQMSVYFPVHSRICPRIRVHIAVYNIRVYVYIVHDRGAEGSAL